jgi:hypothetical protein
VRGLVITGTVPPRGFHGQGGTGHTAVTRKGGLSLPGRSCYGVMPSRLRFT